MNKFILGIQSIDISNVNNEITEFINKDEAILNSEEWCEVRAENLEEAKKIYYPVFEAWHKQNFKGDYPDTINIDGIECMATFPYEPYNKEISGE